ncbi:hypothetical protein ACP8HZ_04935 [Francisella noatunensis]
MLLCYKALLSLKINDFKLTQALKDIDTLWKIALVSNMARGIDDIIEELHKVYNNMETPLKVLVVGAGIQRQIFELVTAEL